LKNRIVFLALALVFSGCASANRFAGRWADDPKGASVIYLFRPNETGSLNGGGYSDVSFTYSVRDSHTLIIHMGPLGDDVLTLNDDGTLNDPFTKKTLRRVEGLVPFKG
jgi:hypothetical protein